VTGADVVLPSASSAATAHNVAGLLVRAWKVRVTAAHLVPAQGPVLLVANHTAFLDAVLLSAASPRPAHVLSEPDVLVPPFDRLLRGTGQLRMDDAAPDRSALHLARALLADGRVVGLFPEGRRGSGDVRHVRLEAPYLAALSGAVVVPVAILGSRIAGAGRDSLPRLRRRIEVLFGAPVDLDVEGDPRRRAVLARSGERLRQALSDHVRTAVARTGQDLPGPLPAPTHDHRSDA
jgi:1-acyl-sn-glycerol-3-phosphate acyltransferase